MSHAASQRTMETVVPHANLHKTLMETIYSTWMFVWTLGYQNDLFL